MNARALIFLAFLTALSSSRAGDPLWTHLSTTTGDLPLPGPALNQTGCLVGDFDHSGKNGFIIGFRKAGRLPAISQKTPPGLVWYRPTAHGWSRYVIEPDYLTIEAGGVALDIVGHGAPDIVFGGDSQSDTIWWWENPYPNFDPHVRWKRHVIKTGGGHQHHDQVVGDFLGIGRPQLVFWNQGAKTVFLAQIPPNPTEAKSWPLMVVYKGEAGEHGRRDAYDYAEGLAAYDVDGDGRLDILAGNMWFKYRGGTKFEPIRIAPLCGRIGVGKFKAGKYPQVVIAPGDGTGPLRWYECVGNPEKSSDWVGHDLLDRDMVHGHSLQVADIDGDGNLDIFAAEMAQWNTYHRGGKVDNPNATAWIFYGDGHGHFRKTVFQKGMDFHEARVVDLNGDGRVDILDKPYCWEVPRVDVWLQRPPPDRTKHFLPVQDVGLELYSFRRELAADLPGTLAKVRQLGFTDVEVPGLYGRTAGEFRIELDKAGLRCDSMVAGYADLRDNLDGVIAQAKALGASYVVNSWIPHQELLTAAETDAAAEDYNRWGARLREAGIQFCYHTHGYEFVPAGLPDRTLFDRLMGETDPQNVKVVMDVFWVIHGGEDPVTLLRRYPNRYAMMHLKDMKRGVHGDLTGKGAGELSVVMGQGQADWPLIIRAAGKDGVRGFYIEDESPDAMAQVPQSLCYIAEKNL